MHVFMKYEKSVHKHVAIISAASPDNVQYKNMKSEKLYMYIS